MTKKKFFNKDLLFYIVMLAFPILQFSLFYIGVNTRSILYSFQTITIQGTTWGFDTIIKAFRLMMNPTIFKYLTTSLLAYVLTYSVSTILALFFSYFIYKKIPMHNMFKLFLFIPSIISSIVIGIIFSLFVEYAVPSLLKTFFHITIKGLFTMDATRFATVIFYNIFIGFGTSVLMYSNAMSGISTEIIEAGKLDGCSSIREFFSIVIPSIFPTISTFAITSIAAIFTNQICLVTLFGFSAQNDVITMGYYLYSKTLAAGKNEMDYPELSAMGLILTTVAVPLTLGFKYLIEKIGPSDK